MARQDPQPLGKKNKRKHRPATAPTDFLPDRSEIAGSDLRLALKVRRTLQLHIQGHYHHEIADKLKFEFKLPKAPHVATISKYLQQASDEIIRDIVQARESFIKQAYLQLDAAKRPILAFLLDDEIQIKRTNREGDYYDEDHIKERAAMTQELVRIVNAQSKLLGVGRFAEDTGEGPKNESELQTWLIGFLTGQQGATTPEIKTAKGRVVESRPEPEGAKLELRSGIIEADELDLSADSV